MRVNTLVVVLALMAALFVAAMSPAAAVESELVRTAGADAASAEDAVVVADEAEGEDETGAEAEADESEADAEAEGEEEADSEEDAAAEEGAEEEEEEEASEEESADETAAEEEGSDAEADAEEETSEEEAASEEGDDARFAETDADVTAAAEAEATAAVSADADISSDAELEAQTVIGAGAVQYVAEGSEEEEEAEEAEARAEEEAAAARFAESAAAVEYDEAFAKEALAYAEAAYHMTPGKCIRALNEKNAAFRIHHKVKQSVFDGSTLYGYTGVDRDARRIVIAFSGDVPLSSLAKRLYKGKPVKVKSLCKSCKTHKYYAHVNSKICPEMIASAKTLAEAHPRYEVVITGHGFGGALASLCGYEMEMNRVWGFNHRRRFISYGQPRSGNAHWARKFNQIFPSAIRVTHADDPVPHIAPCHADPETQRCIELKDRKKRLWAFHAPTQVWYPSDMPAADSNGPGRFTVCKGQNWGEDTACRSHPLGFSLADHTSYFGQAVATRCQDILSAMPAAATVPAGSLPSSSSEESDKSD